MIAKLTCSYRSQILKAQELRFAFQKSAIRCRFLKVRLENTHTGCFLTQDDTERERVSVSFARRADMESALQRSPVRGCADGGLLYNCINTHS